MLVSSQFILTTRYANYKTVNSSQKPLDCWFLVVVAEWFGVDVFSDGVYSK